MAAVAELLTSVWLVHRHPYFRHTSRVREDAMLRADQRLIRFCGFLLLVYVGAISLAQQPDPQQSAAQVQQALQQQAAMRAGGQPAPVLVVKAPVAIAAGLAEATKAPFDALNQEQAAYLDQVLNIWEQRTAQIKQYQCTVTRWQYDPSIDPTSPAVIDKGILQYAKPDKGLFRVDQRQALSKKGPNPEYRESDKFGDYWVCDGEYLHIRDRNEMKALKVQLPPEQRHNGIHNSPLPFLFGVKAEEIKARYWVRPVAPPAGSADVWLEAWPKQLDDAGSYSRVQVVLDAKEVLPKALIVFLPNWEANSPHREVLEFTDRQQDWNLLNAMKQKLFMKEFIETELPATWQVIVEPYIDPKDRPQPNQQSQQRVAQPPAVQQQLR